MDHKHWEKFAALFGEDAEQSWQAAEGEAPKGARGRDAVAAFIRDSLAGMRSTHHGHMPEIEVTSETTATGTLALFDYCTQDGEVVFEGPGYYRDVYVKRGGRRLIRETHLEANLF